MKYRNSIVIFLIAFCLIVLGGCGKVSLESGDVVSDITVLDEGKFDQISINLPDFSSGVICNGAYGDEDGFRFVISDADTYLHPEDIYFISFDLDGKNAKTEKLDLPVYSIDNKVYFSDSFTDQNFKPYSFVVNDGSILYTDFECDKDGSFTSVCSMSVYFEEYLSHISVKFYVTWDKNGKCTSIEPYDYPEKYPEDIILYEYDSLNDYVLTASGINYVDDKGLYKSRYFDFINSGIDTSGFDIAVIGDENHFAGLYKDSSDNLNLACFSRDTSGTSGTTPLLIACTGLNNELKALVNGYNAANDKYRIAVYDYSDRTESGTEEEAWSLLKTDINNGFSPDIVINSTGYDKVYIKQLSESGKISDLTKVISKDQDLENITFSAPAQRLFYSFDNIYCIVPSYTYSTVTGNVSVVGQFENWGIDDFNSFIEDKVGINTIFLLDTKDEFVDRVLTFNGSDYVDYSLKTSNFACDEFVSFLEFAASLPSDYDAAFEFMYSEENNMQYILSVNDCPNLGDMNLRSTITAKGDYIDIGFPHGYSGQGSGVINPSYSIMIMSSSKNTNECWNFIKSFLKDDYQLGMRTAIPVTESAYLDWASDNNTTATSPYEFVYTVDGVEQIVYNPNQERREYIINRIDNCGKFVFSDYPVYEIVRKYSQDYFAGRITVEEAVSSIDNEVRIYLNEN